MPEEKSKTTPMVLCDHLIRIYKSSDIEVLALQGLDLTVQQGEMLAIIGNSGSGKSTLLNILGGLDKPTAGKIIVDGKNLQELNDRELVDYRKKTVGFVWQNSARNLLPYMTAIQNIMVPMLFSDIRQKKERAESLLKTVHMEHRANYRLSELSGGEQQRIAIAIALANEPRLLLADEPTGSVDQKTAGQILDLFRELNQSLGVTIIIVTHDQLLAKKVGRVVSIRDGKVSTERLIKSDYKGRLDEINAQTRTEDVQNEYVIMDKSHRIQLPEEMLKKLQITDEKMMMELKDDMIVLRKPHTDS